MANVKSAKKKAVKTRKRVSRNIDKGQVHITTSFNNNIIVFTDMEGNRYMLEVSNLRYEKHADQATLQRYDAALTLFIKNMYAFEYLIVFCDAPH